MKKKDISKSPFLLRLLCLVGVLLPGFFSCKNATNPFSRNDTISGQQKSTAMKHDSSSVHHHEDTFSLGDLTKPVFTHIVSEVSTVQASTDPQVFLLPIEGRVSFDTRAQLFVSSRISGRIEKMYVHYNHQPVRKGQVLMEIYSPDLVAAQREWIYLMNSAADNGLVESAKKKLLLWGMRHEDLERISTTKTPLYRVAVVSPASGFIRDQGVEEFAASTSNILAATSNGGSGNAIAPSAPTGTSMANGTGSSSSFSNSSSSGSMGSMGSTSSGNMGTSTRSNGSNNNALLVREGQYVNAGSPLLVVYDQNRLLAEFAFPPTWSSYAKNNQKVLFRQQADTSVLHQGMIRMIQPVYQNGLSFTIARMDVSNKKFRVGEWLQGEVVVLINKGFWLPEKAVYDLGDKAVVFKKEGSVFVPKTVVVGVRHQGLVQVLTDIPEWEIAENAYFMVDSEGFIPNK